MIGNGVHNQPPGTWSDDASLALCLAEGLCEGYDLSVIAKSFVRFAREGYWTPHGEVFDIGSTTRQAIERLADPKIRPQRAGLRSERDNGNGALMRILPLSFSLLGLPLKERLRRTSQVTSMTHGHRRAIIASMIYIEMAIELLHGRLPDEAYHRMKRTLGRTLAVEPEVKRFARIMKHDLAKLEPDDVPSGGYVVDTLEGALWCVLTERDYPSTVLKAVNLGGDTDTVAAVAGGLAGIADGYKGIPKSWREGIARRKDIAELANRLFAAVST